MSTTIDAATPSTQFSVTPRPETADRSGKSGQAIGKQAKQALSDAQLAGELPKNIQGQVASALARGLPLDSILALQPVPTDAATDTAQDDVANDAAASATNDGAVTDATDIASTETVADNETVETNDATALDLLDDDHSAV